MKTRLINSYRSGKLLPAFLACLGTFFLIIQTFSAIALPFKGIPAFDLKPFEGSYQLLGDQNIFIKISAYGDQLTLKELWSNREISFKQKADLNFVSTDIPDFTLDFTRDKTGEITQVMAFRKDVWVKVKPKAAPAKLSATETEKLKNTYQAVFTAFEEAINSNADDKIKSFLKTYMDETVLATLTMDNLVGKSKELYQNMGGIERVTQQAIDPATGTATFKGKNQGNLFQMSFTLNSAGKILNFGLKE